MPRWTALPDRLDPDIRSLTELLRRLIDRSGLGVVAVAERTGHDRATWDAYLNARRPVPRSAVVALSDVTGADLGTLTAHWEHADRAWKRTEPPTGPAAPARTEPPAGPEPGPEPGPGPGGASAAAPAADHTLRIRRVRPAGRDRRASPLLHAAGIAGALLVATAAVLLADLGGDPPADGRASAPPPITAPATGTPAGPPPEGVGCAGAECTGEDPEEMGCGGPRATTAAVVRIGSALVEVRHSTVCAAAWARISGAAAGDTVSVEVGDTTRRATVPADGADTDAYTPMLAVDSAAQARACAVLAAGDEGCTEE